MATIEIDGKQFEAENGKMIIEVADDAGIYIPRFCYHKKLSIAANCRMCLVEVENGRKPLPACATPISDGMKVYTKSKEALHSQKVVMDFLLINHPLDCPICDQGGECELQDISMGFGSDESEYDQSKRSVDDDDLGALISTEMTRCIHCTRCVRFGEEIAGVRELGGMGRGEHMQISTFVKHNMTSELSGNVIDLCPVGALTSKPFRFKARAWELSQHESIATHDCLGSNIYYHARRQEVMRVVPKENEHINETWLSDRDRFSYLGNHASNRLAKPKIRKQGELVEVEWTEALNFVSENLSRILKQHGAQQVAGLTSPSASLEEMYLMQKWLRALGVDSLDHRLQMTDFSDDNHLGAMPQNSLEYSDIENQKNLFIIGCNIHKEVPLAGAKVRKAWMNGASIYTLNPVNYDCHFDVEQSLTVSPQHMVEALAKIYVALNGKKDIPQSIMSICEGLTPSEAHEHIASALKKDGAAIIMGAIFNNHPEASKLRTLIFHINQHQQIKHLTLTVGANTPGAFIAGMLPHRTECGKELENPGLNIRDVLQKRLKAYILHQIDPAFDIANPALTHQSLSTAEFVMVLSPFDLSSVQTYADVVLPIATSAETSGTYVNVDNQWQTVKGVVAPFSEARPAWKIFRVLGNMFDISGFEYNASSDVLSEIKNEYEMMHAYHYTPMTLNGSVNLPNNQLIRIGEWPMYRCDSMVRASEALQASSASEKPCIRVHSTTADNLNLSESATISQANIEILLPVIRDDKIAPNAVWVPNAFSETQDLGDCFSSITIKR